MCVGIMPGPKEQTPDQVQRFLRPIVSDLLRLWKHGIKVPTESHPEGNLVISCPLLVIPSVSRATCSCGPGCRRMR